MGLLKYVGDKLFSNGKEVALVGDGDIETGGNEANGYWVKHQDGRLEQYGIRYMGLNHVTTKWGGLFVSARLPAIPYPITFIETPVVSIQLFDRDSTSWLSALTEGNGSLDKYDGLHATRGTTNAGVEMNAHWKATGRWK